MRNSGLETAEVHQMLVAVADRIIASESILSEADRQLGDGDHGLGMARGFSAVKTKLESNASESIAKLFGNAGMAMLSSMGGASGALFGTLFRNGGKALEGRDQFDSAGLADFLAAGLAGVLARGGAKPGDKTMVDALQPAAIKASQVVALPLTDAIAVTATAARAGAEATAGMLAQLGRAKTLGQGSIGHQDPGAISVALILEGMREFICSLASS